MAFVCPGCKEETLSPRSAEIKVCLKCGRLVDWQNVIKLLEKMDIPEKIINQVRNDIVAKEP
jgi:ribosomal protein L37AE/L43A